LPASVDNRAGDNSPFPIASPARALAPRDYGLAQNDFTFAPTDDGRAPRFRAAGPGPHEAALGRALAIHRQTTPPWLISYADLITLLLCFFILLTGATHVEKYRYQPVMASLADQFSGVLDRGAETNDDGAGTIGDLRLVAERMQGLIANAMPLAVIRHTNEADRLEVALPESGLFPPQSDALNALGRSRLKALLAAIREGAAGTPYRLEYRLAAGDAAAGRAAALGGETVGAGAAAGGIGVAIDEAAPAGKLVLRITLGANTAEVAAP
jgi:hypothetical protein